MFKGTAPRQNSWLSSAGPGVGERKKSFDPRKFQPYAPKINTNIALTLLACGILIFISFLSEAPTLGVIVLHVFATFVVAFAVFTGIFLDRKN